MATIRPFEEKDLSAVKCIFDMHWHDDFRDNLHSKLEKYIAGDRELQDQKFKLFVAEEDGSILGVSAIRDLQDHMKEHAVTDCPAEWYVVAVNEIGKGVGSALMSHMLNTARHEKYKEVILFSGESHQDAWKFHDKHFKRIAENTAPNGEKGYVWRRDI